ncbi:multidrug efflux SMR transporter [Tropicimonas sp. IMCC34043]|uniref:DMT family transporter n=1 Tax=Tropicimonas sp. IMCC34043 TaxID=2248760 RepID=UPI000E222479|nr:SMR family transporter [Tropicimonas sp. IMCC34043]
MPAHLLALIGAIVTEVIGTSALTASAGLSRPLPAVAAIAAYAVSIYLLGLAIQTIPVGIAYAIWSGLGIVLISLSGRFIFGQRLDLPAIAGLGLIIAGVLVIQLFSKSSTH